MRQEQRRLLDGYASPRPDTKRTRMTKFVNDFPNTRLERSMRLSAFCTSGWIPDKRKTKSARTSSQTVRCCQNKNRTDAQSKRSWLRPFEENIRHHHQDTRSHHPNRFARRERSHNHPEATFCSSFTKSGSDLLSRSRQEAQYAPRTLCVGRQTSSWPPPLPPYGLTRTDMGERRKESSGVVSACAQRATD